MTGPTAPAFFDGHNDLLARLYLEGGPAAARQFVDGRKGHLDLDKCRTGGFGGGFFAVFVPSTDRKSRQNAQNRMKDPPYGLPLPPALDWPEATQATFSQIATLTKLEEMGALKICTTAVQIKACFDQGTVAALLHIEGAEAIDRDLYGLDVLYRAGLRSIGPVWSRSNVFGHGVPFTFPSTGDAGPGLTDAGKALVRRCDELGIIIDLSHITEAGFWDVAEHSANPLVATHSNAHTVCPHARNLTDCQLDAVSERNGVVGVNLAVAFLRADGAMRDTGLDDVLRHFDHLIGRLGEDGVALGTDFDGAYVPSAIGSAAGLPRLRQAMLDHGYGQTLMEKLCQGNWLRIIGQVCG